MSPYRFPRPGRLALLRLAVDGRQNIADVHERTCRFLTVQEVQDGLEAARQASSRTNARMILEDLLSTDDARAHEAERAQTDSGTVQP